jgi:motility quorum-sensing regulator/GCU-specific mRNA interferase toxin
MTKPGAAKYNLNAIKLAFINTDKLNMTATAMSDQYMLGFNDQDVVDAIQALTMDDFYKSMPPIREGFTAWQDVYKSKFKNKNLYIKFQIDKRGEMIISFKEAGKSI